MCESTEAPAVEPADAGACFAVRGIDLYLDLATASLARRRDCELAYPAVWARAFRRACCWWARRAPDMRTREVAFLFAVLERYTDCLEHDAGEQQRYADNG